MVIIALLSSLQENRTGQNVCCTGIVSRECLELLNIPDVLVIRQANPTTLLDKNAGGQD
jgi:hypothetical protein